MEIGDWFEKHFEHIDRKHEQMDAEFKRLLCEPSSRTPEAGDRVIVAGGFLNMGHLWMRYEAVVEEVGETSVKVRFTDYKMYNVPLGEYRMWVHPALITDVIPKATRETGQS